MKCMLVNFNRNLHSFHVFLTVGLMLGIFPFSSLLICNKNRKRGMIRFRSMLPKIIAGGSYKIEATSIYGAISLNCDSYKLCELKPLKETSTPDIEVCRGNNCAIQLRTNTDPRRKWAPQEIHVLPERSSSTRPLYKLLPMQLGMPA
uniref:Uncharacterized protein n=2 Tax=Salix viminalis TaxID=40686 RepID=A0A6N2N6G6_SALVM